MTAIEQHNLEIHENAGAWSKKPLLQELYGDFYQRLARHLPSSLGGPVVELGSGMGNIKRWLPECVTTDLFENPWLDRVENAYRLSFAGESVRALILLDVWHHLRHPGLALREWHRVLRPGGRVLLLEPDMSALGRFIYGRFHHETLALAEPIAWDAPPGFDPAGHGYYAAQGNAHRVFVRGEHRDALRGWRVRALERLPEFAYVASGGFRGPQLYPRALLPLARFAERLAAPFPALFSTRLLVALEKDGSSH